MLDETVGWPAAFRQIVEAWADESNIPGAINPGANPLPTAILDRKFDNS